MPARLTLTQIEDLLARRDEAQLAAYRQATAEAEAEGQDPGHLRPRPGPVRRGADRSLAPGARGPARGRMGRTWPSSERHLADRRPEFSGGRPGPGLAAPP
jgi:hypothetical protein